MKLMKAYRRYLKGDDINPFYKNIFYILSKVFPFSFLRYYSEGDISKSLSILKRWRFLGGRFVSYERKLRDIQGFLNSEELPMNNKKNKLGVFNEKVLFAFHSCAAFDPSGYTSRSNSIAKGIMSIGVKVNAAVRPGYPWDLPSHKMAIKKSYQNVSGISFRFWPDTNVSLRTPESEYIEIYGELLAEAAKDYGATVIHAASNYLNGMAAAKAASLLGINSVYEVRGLWHITRSFSIPKYRASEHFKYCEKRELAACHSVDKVITISDALKKFLVDKGIPENKISVVGNAASEVIITPDLIEASQLLRSSYGLEKGRSVIGYVGSLVAYEGLDKLIRLLARTSAEARPYLLIAGDGVARPSLELLAQKLGVAKDVLFVGRISYEQVSAHYGLFDLAALPRQASELTRLVPPVKPFEILAHGCPLVVSESVATAVGSTIGSPLLTADFDALKNIDELLAMAITAGATLPIVPTWEQRAREILSIYRQLG